MQKPMYSGWKKMFYLKVFAIATICPFRLAYLESILRKADWAASAKEDGR